MMSQAENDVTNRFVSHGFLLMLNTCFESYVYG
jgi:hypothetical protein